MEFKEFSKYRGVDASLETSLYEYGLIWLEEEKTIHFVYATGYTRNEYGEIECSEFSSAYISKDINPEEEWNWVDFAKLATDYSATKEEFLSLPLTEIVFSVLSTEGYQCTFGESYYRFTIERGEDV